MKLLPTQIPPVPPFQKGGGGGFRGGVGHVSDLRVAADPERLPAQLIRPASGRLLWLVDQDAAKGLGEASS